MTKFSLLALSVIQLNNIHEKIFDNNVRTKQSHQKDTNSKSWVSSLNQHSFDQIFTQMSTQSHHRATENKSHPIKKHQYDQMIVVTQTTNQSHYSASIIGGRCHKYNFCCDKCFVTTNTCLSWKNTSFVTTKVGLSWENLSWENRDDKTFVATNKFSSQHVLSWQAYFISQQKTCFVMTNTMFVATKVCLLRQVLSQHSYVWHGKCLSWQKFCHDKIRPKYFVMTNIIFSQQNFCHNKNDTCGSSHQW